LCVDALVKRFGEMTALDGITLELHSGECLGLLGPNGAGKSTLIRSIVGRVIPDAGTISVFGAQADSMSARTALSTLVILVMSSVGGSMFPRFLMPEAMQKAGLLTINAWAIDGFTKVFWRDEPVFRLWPQVLVLVGIAIVLFAIARRLARRWEFS
jgi:ABC-type branched-subunit amino acid transport system ATPase component